jgi:hypothetical protein
MEQLQYGDKLKEKFKHYPEIKRIKRHRHAQKEIRKMKFSKQASKFLKKPISGYCYILKRVLFRMFRKRKYI